MKDRLLNICLLVLWLLASGSQVDIACGQTTNQLDMERLPSLESEYVVDITPGPTRQAIRVAFQRSSPGSVERVEVQVTASTGASVYLDKGRGANIQPGDEVVLYPPASGIVNATVQSVSRGSSRCVLLSTDARVDIGTRGEVLVPKDRFAAHDAGSEDERKPRTEHPAWKAPPEDWDQSKPLLAPAHSRSDLERGPEMRGRLFANYMHTWNRADGDNQYSLGRIGTALWIDNPMSKGGTFRLRGEFNRRGAFLSDALDDIDGPGRLDRISYRWGGKHDQPIRAEVGRFLSYEFPEFGLVDGAELSYRTDRGDRIGVTAGFLPEPFPNLSTGDDFQVSTYYRFIGGIDEAFSTAFGYQKTWHRGSPDRDLLIYTFDYSPAPRFSMHGSIWSDFYDSRDSLKSKSFEISQAIGQAFYRFNPGRGVGANFSYVRWPQLLRQEFAPFLSQQILEGEVTRYGAYAWQQVGARARLDGRIDQWSDQNERKGTSWEGRISVRDWLYPKGEVSCAVYGTHGVYSSGPGGRVSFYRYFPVCVASIWYDVTDYRLLQLGGRFLQQYVRSNFDFTFGSGKSVTLFADYRFGENQDAFQLGVFLQKRL